MFLVTLSPTVAGNAWRYEKLPIAGYFQSRYIEVEAGFNLFRQFFIPLVMGWF
jgi:hypothetical protein